MNKHITYTVCVNFFKIMPINVSILLKKHTNSYTAN